MEFNFEHNFSAGLPGLQKSLQTAEERSEFVCASCLNQILIHNGFFCPTYGRRLHADVSTCHFRSKFVLAAVASYEAKPVRELIQALKYGGLKSTLNPWRQLINSYLTRLVFKNFDFSNAIIVPIPLYKKREWERGFNQVLLIADLLFECLRQKFNLNTPIPVVAETLKRIKPTQSQTECADYKIRAQNIAGVFAINETAAASRKNIILVDDVFTSGATMNEAARILKNVGAKKILGFVLAKA